MADIAFVLAIGVLTLHFPQRAFLVLAQTKQCSNPIDLVLIFDGSTSINPSEFSLMQQFGSQLVSQLEVSAANSMVGVVQFSSSSKVEISLSSKKESIIQTIESMKQLRGATNMVSAFSLALTLLEYG